jgi:cytochrome c oxidase cbb3-type subunit 1
MTYLFPRLYGRAWYSYALCEWHYWLSTIGVFTMFVDLMIAGVFQGYFWASLQPWDDSVDASQGFWQVRAVAGLAMFAGLLCFLCNLWMTARGERADEEPSVPATLPAVGA